MIRENTFLSPVDLEYKSFIHSAAGKNADFLVCLADQGKDFSSFDSQIRYFEDSLNIIVIWGFNKSSFCSASPREYADWIQRVLTENGCHQAHIVGVGTGSFMAQYFALCNSQMVLSLACVNGSPLSCYRFFKTEKSEMNGTECIRHLPDLVLDEHSAVRRIPVRNTFRFGIFSGRDMAPLAMSWKNAETRSYLYLFDNSSAEINESSPTKFNHCLEGLMSS